MPAPPAALVRVAARSGRRRRAALGLGVGCEHQRAGAGQRRCAATGPGPEEARTVDGIALAACDLLDVAVSTDPAGGRRELREASDLARRAARPVHGAAVRSSRIVDALRWSARDLARLRHGSQDQRAGVMEVIKLLRATASLVEALGELRRAQDRLAQAESAVRAGAVLRSVANRRGAPGGRSAAQRGPSAQAGQRRRQAGPAPATCATRRLDRAITSPMTRHS